jgi:SAM-dependent methyltransferase
LYHELAYLWPIISPPEEYTVEAWHLREILEDKLGPGRHRLLELGVGGGHVLSHLTGDFDAAAVDLSPAMVALSSRLNLGVPHHLGDMRTVRLEQVFDVVLIHDAICYMLTEEDLAATFQTAKAHLRPGGVFLAAPDHFKETFHGPTVTHSNQDREGMRVTCIEYSDDPDETDTLAESVFFYLINREGQLTVEQDRHVFGLFPRETWLRLLAEAGFSVEERNYPPYEGGYGGNVLVGTLI